MEDLSLHILDIAQNAIKAQAKRIEIIITEDTKNDMLTIEIKDTGKGMDKEILKKATDPFFTTEKSKRIGLGLSLLAQAAQETDGDIQIESEVNKGTRIKATFKLSHPDLKPLGNISETLLTLVFGHPEIHFLFEHNHDGSVYRFDSRKV